MYYSTLLKQLASNRSLGLTKFHMLIFIKRMTHSNKINKIILKSTSNLQCTGIFTNILMKLIHIFTDMYIHILTNNFKQDSSFFPLYTNIFNKMEISWIYVHSKIPQKTKRKKKIPR